MDEIISMAFRGGHLPGFRFNPTDEELISHFLRNRRRHGPKFPCGFVLTDANLYGGAGCHPEELAERYESNAINGAWYFYTELIPVSSASNGCKKTKRSNGHWKREAGNGLWEVNQTEHVYHGINAEIGVKRYLVYHEKGPSGEKKKTDWLMYEYRLAGVDVSDEDESWALCKVYHKSSSKNNGAASSSSSLAHSPDLPENNCSSLPPVPEVVGLTHDGEATTMVVDLTHDEEATTMAPASVPMPTSCPLVGIDPLPTPLMMLDWPYSEQGQLVDVDANTPLWPITDTHAPYMASPARYTVTAGEEQLSFISEEQYYREFGEDRVSPYDDPASYFVCCFP